MTAITPTRRSVLKSTGLVLGMTLPIGRALAQGQAGPFAPNAFVRIAPDDSVTVVIKHVEFGQGPATGLSTLVADELDADWGQIRVEMAPANDPLYKNLLMGTMGTGGSTAMANSWTQMRTAGAAARAMLVEAAAKRWNIAPADISVSQGVVSGGGNSARFGELVEDAAGLTPPAKPTLKTPDQWTLIGTDVRKVDSVIKTNGTAPYTMDVRRPGMVHSAIQHPPAFGATVKSLDSSAALAVPGVSAVKQIAQGVVVYASDSYTAMQGRNALEIEWDFSEAETRSSEELFRTYAEAATSPGEEAETVGDADGALSGAAKTLDATYHFPFLAHAPMEPLDAVLELKGNALSAWIGSQFQVGDMMAMCDTLGVPFEKATLHEQYAGGSFGRRAQPGSVFAVEAATVLKAHGGKAPVKHVWSRENDIRGGRYRPLAVHRLRGGVDAEGNIAAWDQVVAIQSFMLGTAFAPKNGVDESMFEGSGPDDYAFANARLGYHRMENGVPTLWWRSVGHTHTAYATETFLDELIELGGQDPVEARLKHLKEDRAKGVVTRVADLAGWGGAVPEGRARGLAFHKAFNTYVAQIAEVSHGPEGVPKVHKVWVAVDCGVPINPNIIRAQMEGGIGYGLGHALYSELVLGEGGRVHQGNFDTYRSLRIHEMPEVEVAIIQSSKDPTGVGEPGLPPSAPAVANAWRALTGKSVRRLPFAHGDNI